MLFAVENNPTIIHKGFAPRQITHAFHDIDGTHSLIRDWPPVMSGVLYDVIQHGLPDGYDSPENVRRLVAFCGTQELPETDRFCVLSAGLSALTQMEWAIRRAFENGKISLPIQRDINSQIIRRIWDGDEHFQDLPADPAIDAFLAEHTPRLFRLYEAVLNGFCRDRNLRSAAQNPDPFRVKGSMEFMRYLKDAGVRNYFVTGAVVEKGMGMYEEVETLGYTIGPDGLADAIYGSSWEKKLPKDVIMRQLADTLGITPSQILVVGDGRSEIAAGVQMGAVTLSRLPADAHTARGIHEKLGTNMIVEDYTNPALFENLRRQ